MVYHERFIIKEKINNSYKFEVRSRLKFITKYLLLRKSIQCKKIIRYSNYTSITLTFHTWKKHSVSSIWIVIKYWIQYALISQLIFHEGRISYIASYFDQWSIWVLGLTVTRWRQKSREKKKKREQREILRIQLSGLDKYVDKAH